MRWFAFLILLSGMAHADVWPQLHKVVGVSVDDVLNVRADPNSSAEKIGEIAPDATAVEVVAKTEDGKWAQVNVDEASGWVAARYLAVAGGAGMPVPAVCVGTEPFWTLNVGEELISFDAYDDVKASFAVTGSGDSQNLLGRHFVTGAGQSGGIGLVMAARACSDGMSDRAFGISVDFGMQINGGWTYLSGCCSVGR